MDVPEHQALQKTVLHSLPNFAQIHVHWVGDAIYLILCHSLTFCLQFFPVSGSFPMHQLFASGGQIIGASASASVIPMNIQDWFPLGLTGLIFLQSRGFSSLLQHLSLKVSVLQHSAFFMVHLSHLYMTTAKTIALTIWIFVGKLIALLFNMLSRLVIMFLPRSKHHLMSWLQSPSAVILEPPPK